MNPGPLCTRRLVWCSVCGALPENEFSLKHMPPADFFPFLIWNSNFYNEHQFPVWRGGERGEGAQKKKKKKFYTIYSANVLDHCGFNKLAWSCCGHQKQMSSPSVGGFNQVRAERKKERWGEKKKKISWCNFPHRMRTWLAWQKMELAEL